MGVRESTTGKNKPILFVGRKFPEHAGTIFIVAVGFVMGLSTRNYGQSFGKTLQAEKLASWPLPLYSTQWGGMHRDRKENWKEIWEGSNNKNQQHGLGVTHTGS